LARFVVVLLAAVVARLWSPGPLGTRLASVDDEESNVVNPTDEEGKSPNTEKEEEGNPDGDGGENPGSQVRGRWLWHKTRNAPVSLDGTELVVVVGVGHVGVNRRQGHEHTGPS
jgi:hypothetical protein